MEDIFSLFYEALLLKKKKREIIEYVKNNCEEWSEKKLNELNEYVELYESNKKYLNTVNKWCPII
jgi:TRAP-type mannitol/chloroaromatic compound transport system substrate-binding protein